MYRNLVLILAGCAVCVGVFLVTFTGTRRGRADYVWNNGTEPQTLDPTLMSGQPEGEIAISLFEGLTAYHPRTLEPVPAVAESWEIDGLTYTFRLRPDAWWVRRGEIFEVDGKRRHVVASDVVYTFRRHLHPETGSEYSFLLYPIAGAEAYERAVAAHWSQLVARYRVERPDVSVTRAAALTRPDREMLERFRDEKFRELVAIRTPDELTVQFTLSSPTPYFLFLMSFYTLFIVPREPIEAHGEAWTRPENLVSSGAYWLDEWRFNSHVRLRKNRHYWENAEYAERRFRELRPLRDAGAIAGFQLRELELLEELGPFVENGLEICDALAVEELNTSVNLYLNGDVDRIREIPSEIRGDLVKHDRRPDAELRHLHHGTINAVYYYGVNMRLPVFRTGELGRKLRRALALSIDRQSIVEIVTRGFQTPAYRIVPEGVPNYDSTPLFGSGDYAADLAEARRLVGEVRAAGLDIPKLQVLYNTLESHARIAAFIQSIWKRELGIDVQLSNQEWGVYLDSRRTGQFDICRAGWIGDYPDPNTFLDMFTTENQNNDPKYSNPVYDRIVLRYCAEILAHLETDETRAAMLADVESWSAYDSVVGAVRLEPGGPDLARSLRDAVESYARTPRPVRIDRAFEIRMLLFHVAETMLMHDMPTIPIYFDTRTQLWPPELRGMHFNARDAHPLKTLRWEGDRGPASGSRYRDFPRFRAGGDTP